MNVGDAFVPISDVVNEHLWIIITKPDENGMVAMVNVTTKRAFVDESCILQVGDHPYVQHESVIAYQRARTAKLMELETFSAKKVLKSRPAVGPDLLARIQSGALASIYTPRGIKVAVRSELGIMTQPESEGRP